MGSGVLEIGDTGLASRPQATCSAVGVEPVLRLWSVWRARARDRRAWWKADDYLLRDAGLTRAQVIREASKPCWRR